MLNWQSHSEGGLMLAMQATPRGLCWSSKIQQPQTFVSGLSLNSTPNLSCPLPVTPTEGYCRCASNGRVALSSEFLAKSLHPRPSIHRETRRRDWICRAEDSSSNGSVKTVPSSDVKIETEEKGATVPSEAKGTAPSLSRSSSLSRGASEKFNLQLKRVAEAASINGRVGYVSRSALRLAEEAEEQVIVPEEITEQTAPEIVLKADEIARLTGKTKKGIKKGLKKLVEKSASSHGHHNAAKLVTTDWANEGQTHRASARRQLMIDEAWRLLRGSVVKYQGEPVGTVAAADPSVEAVNYDQVFIRDFVPSALAFMLEGEHDIVKNFLLQALQLQSWDKTMDCFSPGEGLMPASFKVQVRPCSDGQEHERLDADFGESAIGRVAPVDSGLWWIILLRAYLRATKDEAVRTSPAVQKGMRLILKLMLRDGFDMFPTLLVPDGSCMIDRRMGIDGHPLEIQSLYYSALQCAKEMLTPEDNQGLLEAIDSRLSALAFHLRQYYWLDFERLNEIYRYQTEEYSEDAANKFNIYPDSLPSWLMEWMPEKGGYFIGGVAPAQLDFRVFTLGNCWAILSSLATPEQTGAILDLYEQKWADLIADMPLKICYPAMAGEEWRIVTGCDPKNTAWSYHNGGSWPTLLWHFTAACIKGGRPELARKAMDKAEKKLAQLGWPEYFDGVRGNYVGKQARKFQTWTIAGFLVARQLLDDPKSVELFACEDSTIVAACACTLGKSDVFSDSD